MYIEHQLLSNRVILSVLKEYMEPISWVNFLVSVCNPYLEVSSICRHLGLDSHLQRLQNPLLEGWGYDESKGIITL